MSESEADKKEPPGKALCALDIGGTLAKLVCLVKEEEVSECEGDESTPREGGPLTTECNGETFRLKFRHFFTARVEELIDFLKSRELVKPGQQLPVTGGGAYKFEELFAERFKCTVAKRDEMSSVISGLDFLLGQKGVAYKYDPNKEQKVNVELSRDIYPFLVVNVGSGVSVLRVNGPKDFVRVTGTCIGGGTVLGLSHILFGAESFDEVVRLSEKGTTELDLTVRDLLGDSAGSGTLPANKTASSFGRVYMKGVSKTCEELRRSIKREDLARSLIHMVSFNLGYIAYLVARIQNVHRVFFAGKYLNNHEPTIASITRGMRFYQEHYHGLGDEDLDDSVAHVTRRGPRTPEEARGRAMGEAGGGGSSLSGRVGARGFAVAQVGGGDRSSVAGGGGGGFFGSSMSPNTGPSLPFPSALHRDRRGGRGGRRRGGGKRRPPLPHGGSVQEHDLLRRSTAVQTGGPSLVPHSSLPVGTEEGQFDKRDRALTSSFAARDLDSDGIVHSLERSNLSEGGGDEERGDDEEDDYWDEDEDILIEEGEEEAGEEEGQGQRSQVESQNVSQGDQSGSRGSASPPQPLQIESEKGGGDSGKTRESQAGESTGSAPRKEPRFQTSPASLVSPRGAGQTPAGKPSRKPIEVLFVKHDGYLGALGALVLSEDAS